MKKRILRKIALTLGPLVCVVSGFALTDALGQAPPVPYADLSRQSEAPPRDANQIFTLGDVPLESDSSIIRNATPPVSMTFSDSPILRQDEATQDNNRTADQELHPTDYFQYDSAHVEHGGVQIGVPYTTGAPFPGDGGFYIDFHEPHPPGEKIIEFLPTLLTKPNEPLGNALSRLLCRERDELESALHDHHLGPQPIPMRPPLIVEWNERFLGPGELAQGLVTPTGAAWRPAIWVWGETRSAIQHFDNGVQPHATEWANRVDLFAQLNLSGTERLLYGVRPLDEENQLGTGRRFAGYDFGTGDWLPGGNFDTQTFFFEGDFGELFPMLDPYDHRFLDYGFSIGRMPILAQQGLLINEDRIDAVTLTRNTINGLRNLNLRVSGVFAWDQITRNSPLPMRPNLRDHNSRMFAIMTESDYARSTINADVVHVEGDAQVGDLTAVGLSAIRRYHLHENTYNTSLHLLGSFPQNGRTDYADQGELLFGQLSWTPHHYFDLIYLNAFWAIDQFTSPARGPLMGGPLGQTGLLFAGAGVGRFGAPIAVKTNDLAGMSLGYQWFFDHTRQQVIWEVGGTKETRGPTNRGTIGTALNYQKACGQHYIFVLGGAVAKAEGTNTGYGIRTEIRTKF